MLTIHQLTKSYDLQPLFRNITFSLNPGDRIGLVGPNGCGKTTLLRLIVGEDTADSGHVTMAPDLRLGYLPQGFTLAEDETVGQVVGRAAGDAAVLEKELAQLGDALARQPQSAALQQQYDALLQRISRSDAGRAAAILAGLGLDDVPADLPVGYLSGGQKTRLLLALTLLGDPHLLLLDEPTNHLDIAMLEWLEAWLAEFPGGVLLVSHDRTFLDRTVNTILALDPITQMARAYPGNYSDYYQAAQLEREKQWAAYHDQQQEIRRVRQDILRVKAKAAQMEREASSVRIGGGIMKQKGAKDYQQSLAKGVAQKARAREKKLERYLEDEERVTKPRRMRQMRLDFGETAHLGQAVIALEELSVGYDAARPLLSHLNLYLPQDGRVVLTGANGSGKTTLLRTIAGELQPLNGRVYLGPSVQLGYMTQEQANIAPNLTPLQTVQPHFASETAARTFLGYFLFTGDEPLKRNAQLSYGQRARLSLAQMVLDGCNVLLLDEPINHLDIPSRAQFEEALTLFQGAVLAVVHDRYFIERFATEVWWVEDGGIRRIVKREA